MKKHETALLRYWKRSSRLFFAEVDGDLWWTNSYVACRVTPVVVDLLGYYNLDAEPMNCTVDQTVMRNSGEPVKLADLVDKAAKAKKRPAAEPIALDGYQLYTDQGPGPERCELWQADGVTIAIGEDNARLLRSVFPGGVAWSADVEHPSTFPLLGRDPDGVKPTALLTPLRHLLTGRRVSQVVPSAA